MIELFKETFRQWKDDHAAQMAAATAYYALFSLAPLAVLTLMIAGTFLRDVEVEGRFFEQVDLLLGEAGGQAVRSLVSAAQITSQDRIAAAISIAVLLFGASILMKQLQLAFNTIWRVEKNPKKSIIKTVFFKRIFSMAMVVTIGFLFLLSLLVTAGVSAIVELVTDLAPALKFFLPLLNYSLSFVFITLLFATLYKFLPDIGIRFKHVLPGAFVAAVLFSLGQFALGYYIGQTDMTARYGVAGSVILILLWVNYSSQILYFGAAFVRQYTIRNDITVKPKSYSVFVPEKGKLILRRSKLSFFKKMSLVSSVLFFEGRFAWRAWRLWKKVKK